MEFKFNKFGVEALSGLTPGEKSELLELIVEQFDGKKISNKLIKSDKKVLTRLSECAIISYVAKESRYYESLDKKFYLNTKDFEKLLLKYSKEQIDDMVIRFEKWTGSAKLDRLNIYLTISRWLRDSNKFILTDEQKTFIEKSFNAYVNNTEVPTSSLKKYSKELEKLFSEGVKVSDIREYWMKVIPIEMAKTDDPQFRRRPTTVIKEFANG